MDSKSIDKASNAMIKKAEKDNVTLAWDRLQKQEPQCGFGQLGICCRNCNMGPCRIDPFGDGAQEGVCGATAHTIVARNLLRAIASGAAAHSDHGRGIAMTLRDSANGVTKDYPVKDVEKLKSIAGELGVQAGSKSTEEIAREVAGILLEEFGSNKGSLDFTGRAPEKRRELWEKLGISPRGIDREVVESMHRTHMGMDSDHTGLILQGMRTALSDGWGGSHIATELSDVLFGTPKPVKGETNLGVLAEDRVNILLHGHEPALSDLIVQAAREPEMGELAKEKGAAGINVCGMCCTGNEILMRHGVPAAGNFLQQELAIVTGAVEAMVVDVQCIMPSLPQVANCYHTKLISTSSKAKFPGAEHIEMDEHNAFETAKKIVWSAIENYPHRNTGKVNIPSEKMEYTAGFSAESILEALGGSPGPLVDALKSGQIKGIAAIVGCNNPKYKQDYSHITYARRLVKEGVLVVGTGCAMIASAKEGLLRPEAASEAGSGLRDVCQSLGIPPVLHMGSCIDVSRILFIFSAIAEELGVDISDLPVVAAAPEWMSEKAISIGTYAVASGVYTILGTVPPVLGSKQVAELLTEGARDVVEASFAVEEDPDKAADLALHHITQKRKKFSAWH